MIFVPAIVFGATMCAKNNTLVVALDSSVGGSTYTQDNANSKWTTTFAYGIVKGVSACTSFSGGSQGNTTKNEITRGERNGQYCWCRLTHPVSSLWAFYYDYGSASNCASRCATAVTASGTSPRCARACLGRSRLTRIDVTKGAWAANRLGQFSPKRSEA